MDITNTIKEFYESTPFPSYEDIDSSASLRQKAEQGVFARLLDEQIPHNSMILEVGCGTGQLSNFLATTWGRNIIATDICLNSMRLGREFKDRNGIEHVLFAKMDIFEPIFKPETFALVICNGVLHHTGNPFLGFQKIVELTKKGGYVIIGLYNKYGRVATDIRRVIFKVFGEKVWSLDSRLRSSDLSEERKHIWFMDQYRNPHESKHTIGEVLRWFDSCGVEYLNGIPKPTAFDVFLQNEQLFEVNPRGSKLDHFLVQLGMMLSDAEGGFFIMIGRKR